MNIQDKNQKIINLNNLEYFKSLLLNTIYPIGCVYISVSPKDPSMLFGGTWERIEDIFLLAAGEIHSAGSMGGEEMHVLTTNELAIHTHAASDNTPNTETYNSYKMLLWRDQNSESTSRSLVAKGTDYQTHVANPNASDYGGNNDLYFGSRTGSGGGGEAHNNMPPYLAVYMWKRIN